MLFNASITSETLKSEEKLCEQLYIFLEEYVPVRLRYESRDEQEDCIQETMLYLLKRYNMLKPADIEGINIEKFFYNRAHSYIGATYQRKLKAYRNANKRLIEDLKLSKLTDEQDEAIYINIKLIKDIIREYRLPDIESKALLLLATDKLVSLGYHNNISETLGDIPSDKSLEILKSLSFAVVDTYLVDAAKDEVTKNK